MRVAVFGSAFNPMTKGHLDAIDYVLQTQRFDQLWLVPSYSHAFGKQMLAYEHRVEMLHQVVSSIEDPKVRAMPLEPQIAVQDKPVYTYDLLHYCAQQWPECRQWCFVMGPDNQKNWHKFYRAEEVEQRFGTLVVPERVAVRSTLVREAIAAGKDIGQWVPEVVAHYIEEQKLYV